MPKPPRKAVPKPGSRGKGTSRRPYGSLTVALVNEALRAAAGIRAGAAEMLRVDRSTVTKFIQAHPEIEQTEADIVEELADLAEGKLLQGIKEGQFPNIKFFLENKARHRGYGRSIELTGKDGGAIRTQAENIDLKKLSTKQLREFEALLAAAAVEGGADDAAES